MDTALFRKNFPEFADAGRYTNQMIEFWGGMGEKLVDEARFGTLYIEGVQLFTAHNVALASQERAAAAQGGTPGGSAGPIASKAVGSVNVSYDTAGSMETNAGHWNQTVYGRQYIRLARLIGQGAVQL